jgi:hypothetical protein
MKNIAMKWYLTALASLVILTVLKLTHVIAWNWWGVLTPTWITLVIFFGLTIIINCVPVGMPRNDDSLENYERQAKAKGVRQ